MSNTGKTILKITGRVLAFVLATVIGVLLAAGIILDKLVFNGPSVEIRNKATMTLVESSAMKWVPGVFFPQEEVDAIYNSSLETEDYGETDTSLITIAANKTNEAGNEASGPVADEWGFVDEDGDGIILDAISGEGYSGYMMIVLDPSRVTFGTDPEKYWREAHTVNEWYEIYDAAAATNAGGFLDENGQGNGRTPDSLVVYEGEIYLEGNGVRDGFVGIDYDNILHTGKFTANQIKELNIKTGVCFGPVLVVNGESVISENNSSGLNPRTAIGQRSDGAILMLVVDGRQGTANGATILDTAEIMLNYGAVNACNLDGGSSTRMIYQGKEVNNAASVKGNRPVPTAVIVLKQTEGASDGK